MSDELKSCPAGCENGYMMPARKVLRLESPSGAVVYRAACICGCSGPAMPTRKEAIDAWNALPRHVDQEEDWRSWRALRDKEYKRAEALDGEVARLKAENERLTWNFEQQKAREDDLKSEIEGLRKRISPDCFDVDEFYQEAK